MNVAWSVINDANRLAAWWPWLRAKGTTVAITGDSAEARVEWRGSTEVGSATVAEVNEGESVAWRVQRREPRAQAMTANVALVDRGTGLRLAWGLTLERRSFIGKLVGLFSDEEEELAADLGAGLASLTELVATAAREQAERDEARRAAEAKARAAKAAAQQPALLDVFPSSSSRSGDEAAPVRTKRPSDYGPDRETRSSSDG
ncbi:MAG: SRPBCC family protein [Deltaproteobacteria bacterium]|nr:SRPBCC family protein [Deltaproteobacteria bacterium]